MSDSAANETLNDEERRVLAGLVRHAAQLDSTVSAEERARIASIADEHGGESFWLLVEKSTELGETLEQLLSLAVGIRRQSACETIYGCLYELAIADGVDGKENALLESLATLWNLKIVDLPPE